MPMVDMGWLREHVAVPENETYEELARDLVRVGLEEEEIHTSNVTRSEEHTSELQSQR